MASVEVAFTQAQEKRLRDNQAALDAAADGAKVRIYRAVPVNAVLPYIIIGEDQLLEDSDECSDAWDLNATVHVFTKPDPPEAITNRSLAAVVRDLLKADLALDGYRTVDWTFESTRILTEADRSTHAVLNHSYALEPA
jgi:hypothetical protein